MANEGFATYTILDESGEVANSRLNVGVVTALSLPGLLTGLGSFESALAAVIIGAISKKSLSVYDNPTGAAKPTNAYAQRELRWLVHYHDNTATLLGGSANPAFGNKYTVEFACPDLAAKTPGKDEMDITTAGSVGLAFKTAFEASFRSPGNGNVVIDYVELVGRKG